MRTTAVQFTVQHPGKKFRHEKPDLKLLLERKESDYVDVSSESWLQGSDEGAAAILSLVYLRSGHGC